MQKRVLLTYNRIRLKLNANTNISKLAAEVIDKCRLINSSRQDELEQVLYYLQKREFSQSKDSSGSILPK
jgi:hypothetical protein